MKLWTHVYGKPNILILLLKGLNNFAFLVEFGLKKSGPGAAKGLQELTLPCPFTDLFPMRNRQRVYSVHAVIPSFCFVQWARRDCQAFITYFFSRVFFAEAKEAGRRVSVVISRHASRAPVKKSLLNPRHPGIFSVTAALLLSTLLNSLD